MLSRVPVVGLPINCADLLDGFMHTHKESVSQKFSLVLSQFIQSKYVYLTNSGTSSFYTILEVLKENSKKKEIIMPAYTAGSLIVGVIKAGLKPVLCDICLEDFNLDRNSLLTAISQNTLAVVCVHMFGIGINNIEELRKEIPSDIFLIEDCAQAMGSKLKGKQVGSFGDISLFSFNRGKNLATYGGGFSSTNLEELAKRVEEKTQKLVEQNLIFKFLIPFKILALSLAVRPFIYGLGYPIISQFEHVSPLKSFTVKKITNFQASVGLALLKKMEQFSKKRYQNGLFLIERLKDIEGIILPRIPQDSHPAFNRLPILFKDLDRREKIEKRLWKAGIETSRMYLSPLHYTFNLGYKKEEFPKAVYLAEHLLTLPVHPLVKREDLLRMIDIIKSGSDN